MNYDQIEPNLHTLHPPIALLLDHLLALPLGIPAHMLHSLGPNYAGLVILHLAGVAGEGDQLGGAGGWLVTIACWCAGY